jgi:hypothetical protein
MVPLFAADKARAFFLFRPRPKGPRCLLRGTAILTDGGPVAIELLTVGQRVLTESGAFKPIKGIGSNVFRKEPHRSWGRNAPVRIARGAISANVPERDLYLSRGHSLFIDGCLVPVKDLVNGISIVQVAPPECDTIEYFHVEFEQHEVIYAEGAAVESLLREGREAIDDFASYERADSAVAAMAPYAPMLGHNGARRKAAALLRLAVSPLVDIRDRNQIVHDRLAARARLLPSDERETALAA